MNDLKPPGLVKGMIFESIVTTYSIDETPNAAPMGIESEDSKHIIIRPFKSTKTYQNLKNRGCAVINFIVEPTTFYKTAFKDENIDPDYFNNFFEKASVVDAPRLKKVDGFLEVSVLEERGTERPRFRCSIDYWKILASSFKPYCRGVFATMEAIIYATKIREFLAQGNKKKARRLIELIEHYRYLINRVAPKSKYSNVIEEIMVKVNVWKTKLYI